MSYSQDWLNDSTRARGLLVVATGYNVALAQEQTLYWSTMGFITTDGTVFNPVIAGDLNITESMSIDGSISMTYGDLEILNPNGELDDYVDNTKWIWSNRTVKIYYGDPRWTLSTVGSINSVFYLIYDGIIDDCKSRNRGVLNIVLRDKQERLNVPVTEDTIGTQGTWATSGGQTNQDNVKPLIFGEVHNITPVLVDPSTLKYLFNNGPSENLIEVRDNGFPIYTFGGDVSGAVVDLNNSTFTLTKPAAGSITCSVQGVKTTYSVATTSTVSSTYINNVFDTIRLLATNYGTVEKRFLSSEIDNTNFQSVLNSFTATPSCGYAVLDRETLLEVMQKLARSVGCQLYVTRSGLLQILRLGVPTSDASVEITDDGIVKGSLSISNKSDPIGSVKLAYCKNWTVQANLATAIPPSSKENFSTDWLLETATDAPTISLYKVTSDPQQKETYLITTASATEEATRLLNYFKITRTVYRFTASSKYISLKLGQPVVLKHRRFGLNAGKSGQVISVSPQWCNGLVDLEVIV